MLGRGAAEPRLGGADPNVDYGILEVFERHDHIAASQGQGFDGPQQRKEA